MAAHHVAAQRLVPQRLAAALGRGVEDHALAEDRRHERVRLGLVQVLVGGAEEVLVGFGAGQEYYRAAGEVEGADVAALGSDAAHQGNGVASEFFQVIGARDDLELFHLTGASGWTSIRVRCAPGRVVTIAATALATSAGFR